MDNNNWTKISDRKPEFPAWLWAKALSLPVFHQYTSEEVWRQFTHWQPANIPAPPPKELTQFEKDEEAWREWFRNQAPRPSSSESWHAALACEREECEAALLEAVKGWLSGGTGNLNGIIRDFFRARREGGDK